MPSLFQNYSPMPDAIASPQHIRRGDAPFCFIAALFPFISFITDTPLFLILFAVLIAHCLPASHAVDVIEATIAACLVIINYSRSRRYIFTQRPAPAAFMPITPLSRHFAGPYWCRFSFANIFAIIIFLRRYCRLDNISASFMPFYRWHCLRRIWFTFLTLYADFYCLAATSL